jgi:cytochrome c-type biogenesis protein CcmF
MRTIGQLSLLVALVCAGYAAFVSLMFPSRPQRWLRWAATGCGIIAFAALSGAITILAWALLERDFRFQYVVQYSSRLLPWNYALSALWVGQAGSLLVWSWLLAGLTLTFRWLSKLDTGLRQTAFGVLLGSLTFLIAILVFAADPFQSSVTLPHEGLGLSPLLQHPSMMIHPPVVFFAYAAWTIPFALAIAALLRGRIDGAWTHGVRPWALFAWIVLLAGLLLGADWAYQQLGWGGYWGWDPVENGSLLPWLTGTAFIHSLTACRYRGGLKKTVVALAIVTFGMCHFATFLTRSGIFSSVHAFSESPIGWFFLGLMAVLLVGGATLIVVRRQERVPLRKPKNPWARETFIVFSIVLLLIFAAAVMIGTLIGPISKWLVGRTIVVEPAFYNRLLVPVGLSLLAVTAVVPLLRWGEAPARDQRRILAICLVLSIVAITAAPVMGARHYIWLILTGIVVLTVSSLLGAVLLEARRREPQVLWLGICRILGDCRPQYAGYVVHLGFVVLAIGVAGSSFGTRRQEMVMKEGETVQWADRQIHYVELVQRELPGTRVAEAVLEVSEHGRRPVTMRPARHWHLLENDWTTHVDIHSTWRGDFYTVLNAGLGDGQISLTLVDNPLMRCIWFGGSLACLGALTAAVPVSRRRCHTSGLLTDAPQTDGEDLERAAHRCAA